MKNHTNIIANFSDQDDIIKKRGSLSRIITDTSLDDKTIVQSLNNLKETPVSWRFLQEHIKIKLFLGSGSFGSAFSCDLDFNDQTGVLFGREDPKLECTVKIANDLLHKFIILKHSETYGTRTMECSLGWLDNPINKRIYDKSKKDINDEYKNAERVVNPWRRNSNFFNSDKTLNLKDFDETKLHELRVEMNRYIHHRGYENMHKIIHFDDVLCLLISEPCVETMFKVIESQCYDKTPILNFDIKTDLGRDFVKFTSSQLGWGMKYLIEEVGMCHSDLKPDNVFFCVDMSKTPNPLFPNLDQKHYCVVWKYADFGAMLPSKPGLMPIECCTEYYTPRELLNDMGKTLPVDPPTGSV
jgi:serine/threonine protein kinase